MEQSFCLESIEGTFSVCKLAAFEGLDLDAPFTFTGSTDGERSLVCPTAAVPDGGSIVLAREDGWRMLRVRGQLDFALIGILAQITAALAEAGVSVFAVSTFDTDYVLVRETDYATALTALARFM